MDFEAIILQIQEATKHFVADSISDVHDKIQRSLAQDHRSAYNDGSWESYPQLHHVFGDKDKGQAVYKQDGQHYRAKYKMDNGGYSIGPAQPVQLAYVPDNESVAEALGGVYTPEIGLVMERFVSTKERRSMSREDFAGKGQSFPINKPEDVRAALDSIGRAGDGNHPAEVLKANILAIAKRKGFPIPKSDEKKEAGVLEYESETTLFMQESARSKGNTIVKLISPGKGSSGYYSAEVLQAAANAGIFIEGMRMFADHQTADERAARPEGEIHKWVATSKGKGYWDPQGPDGPGVYTESEVYPDFKPFLKARKDDMGVSIRAGVTTTGRMIEGVPEVKEMRYIVSSDFVTRAGRGGKVIEMFESYRSVQGRTGEVAMTADEQKKFDDLAKENGDLKTRLDRLEEKSERQTIAPLAQEAAKGAGLGTRAVNRVVANVTREIPKKDGVVDMTAVQESIKKFVKEEVDELQEAGVHVSPARVRGNGGLFQLSSNNGEELTDEKLLAEAGTLLDRSVKGLAGIEVKEDAA